MSEPEAPDQTPCPKCGALVDTWDGWCLRHEACGYCAHPAREYVAEGDKCSLCGDVRPVCPKCEGHGHVCTGDDGLEGETWEPCPACSGGGVHG